MSASTPTRREHTHYYIIIVPVDCLDRAKQRMDVPMPLRCRPYESIKSINGRLCGWYDIADKLRMYRPSPIRVCGTDKCELFLWRLHVSIIDTINSRYTDRQLLLCFNRPYLYAR